MFKISKREKGVNRMDKWVWGGIMWNGVIWIK